MPTRTAVTSEWANMAKAQSSPAVLPMAAVAQFWAACCEHLDKNTDSEIRKLVENIDKRLAKVAHLAAVTELVCDSSGNNSQLC
jgi:hypothetical protein